MPEVQIEIMPNGPYIVTGPVDLIDSQGNAVPVRKQVIALCRCGGSKTKPFCDGTHSDIGFQGAEAAVAEADAEAEAANPGE